MPVTVVVGAQWGDEGKAKVIDLQLLYADRSPRFGFADNIRIHHTRNRGPEVMRDLMTRWGQSVSFHDFEHVTVWASELWPTDGDSASKRARFVDASAELIGAVDGAMESV